MSQLPLTTKPPQELDLSIRVCKECHTTTFLDDGSCGFCLGHDKVLLPAPALITCGNCGNVLHLDAETGFYTTTSGKREYYFTDVPYLSLSSDTFYDGCHGWD